MWSSVIKSKSFANNVTFVVVGRGYDTRLSEKKHEILLFKAFLNLQSMK